ncbi:tRNA guanosine(15) transglycosylase TgtA [Sulfuracidifex metallicus]|uniref:tRNA guanosine(15) transglycosylase TgtA n=1 Tax=Sulfuracidifex metallicus TaxID=47303 RepID=UPI003C6EA8BA
MIGDFEVREEDLAGRIGKLETRHGTLETPTFFPVIHPVRLDIGTDILKKIGFNNFITNAFLIYKNRKNFKKIHEEFKFDGTIMTDSGAYQILQYGNVDIDNLTIVEFEKQIKPDIAVILDLPTGNTEDRAEAEKSVEETIKRVGEVYNEVDDDIIWTYPIQGGRYLDLIRKSTIDFNKFKDKFKFAALGSPTVLLQEYDYRSVVSMLVEVRTNLSRGVPLHLFGGGVPHMIPIMVALGVDSFDSASYILYARDNRYITRDRVLKLEEMDYFPCSCDVCAKYTPKELLEMDYDERIKLLAIHNLYTIKLEINSTKQAIKEGRLFEYLQEKSRSHPAVYSAFKEALKYNELLEKFDNGIKPTGKGIFLFDYDSVFRPEIRRFEKILNRYEPKSKNAVLICYEGLSRPFLEDELVRKYVSISLRENKDVFIVVPFFGLIPIYWSDSYPLAQFELSEPVDDLVRKHMIDIIKDFITKKNYSKVEVVNCKDLHIESIGTLSSS